VNNSPVQADNVQTVSAITVSCVNSAIDTKTRDYDAKEMIESIRDDKYFKLRESIEDIRNTFRNVLATKPNDRKAAKEAVSDKKRRLPGVLWSGIFNQRNNDGLLQHSGLLCADLDLWDINFPRPAQNS
jgi:hypothetical protein